MSRPLIITDAQARALDFITETWERTQRRPTATAIGAHIGPHHGPQKQCRDGKAMLRALADAGCLYIPERGTSSRRGGVNWYGVVADKRGRPVELRFILSEVDE